MASFHRTYRLARDGTRVDGVFAMAFIHNDEYHLVPISIYRDGQIDCWGLVDLDGFRQKVRSGWVVVQPPQDATIAVDLGQFTAANATYWVRPDEFIKEVADEIERLNCRPTAADRCRLAWAAFETEPSAAARQSLAEAYEAVPEHLRIYVLGDMDRKDHPIRRALFPEEYER